MKFNPLPSPPCDDVGAARRRADQFGPFFSKVALTPNPSPGGRGVPRTAVSSFPAPTLTLTLSLRGRGDRCTPPRPVSAPLPRGGGGHAEHLSLTRRRRAPQRGG